MKRVLLMLSGGLDSTYMLHHYLTETEFQVHAHHIAIRYPHLPRWQQEGPAVKKIVAYCRHNYRPFEYSESYFGMGFTHDVGWDSDLQLLVASKVVLNLPPDPTFVALGWCEADLARPEVAARSAQEITPNVWRSLWASIGSRPHIERELAMPLVDMKLSKTDIAKRLPMDLLKLCWSCRAHAAAASDRPCGQCGSCRVNHAALAELGLTARQLPNLLADPLPATA
jgi:7-cyano-7-deazaguanine synthase in queuosine biosynthesis